MEAIFIYLLKSSGLITVFYLAYHFLVRKETFFNSNRWFLLSGLFTSLLLPLFIIKKIILVERPKIAAEDLVAYSQISAQRIQDVPAVEAFDWMQFIWISYIIIACVLVIRIVFNFTSLYRMLYQQQVIKREQFKLVNLNENIAPFSFFNYIVYNSDLYSTEELQSILLHEKIHSQEKHSLDVLIAKLFCIVFWFNPFMWLYKKAITQNLEYIADQKAIEQLEDKKSYQRALLKVVSHQSCLSITNNFYQSLIKKRIVMLNKNQSHKRNSWKYAMIIPALIGFVFLFQIKTIAQEKEENVIFTKAIHKGNEVRVTVNKNSTDAEMKKDASELKKTHGITLKYSKVKRNSDGEITGIKVEFKDKDGNKGVSQVDGKEPIKPIHFYKNDSGVGFGRPKELRMYTNYSTGGNDNAPMAIAIGDSVNVVGNFDFDFDLDLPEPPEAPESPEAVELPEAPEAFAWGDNQKIIIKTDGDKKPMVIINGKVLSDEKEIEEALQKYGAKGKGKGKAYCYSYSSSSDGDSQQIIINGKDVMKIKSDAMANANIQMKKLRPMMAKQMELAKLSKSKARAEMDAARAQLNASKPEMEAAKAEMNRAKEEMLKAKAEMEAAKAEYEKAKAELKK
ncbi:M56 family metallopeptidase [Flavobacterium wongokense]|uniref:M56 family metallopeptidase n=1 Tax=Flavobacterium wongokense TaxID=2910674 RepID=UPI001F18BB81|nr:M56 family metallopeptidase [Flavobacterium sp. WG47]MCF6132235.1 M56 family metallopeptidase [Flavobacterium sp. WG47]